MKTLIKKFFNVSDADVLPVLILIGLGFFMGIFSATYSVASTTLFLNNFDEQSDLPKAFILSGLVGLSSAYLYSYLQRKIRFEKLILIFTATMVAMVAVVIAGFYFFHDFSQIVFLCFVLVTPLITHISLIFWGLFGRMFTIAKSRKIIGNVDSGQLVASIIALFSIPVLLTLLSNVQGLILISLGSLAVFFLLIVFTVSRNLLKTEDDQEDEKTEDGKTMRQIFKSPYILSMALFVMVSMIAVTFVDYSFLNVASAQFADEKGMAFFLSVFEGAIVVLSFIIQTFFTDRFIENYGLKVSLLATPVILLIFIILSSLIGLTLFEDYGPQSPTFLAFFILVALSKMFSSSLKDAVDGPVFKLYFMPLDKKIRFDAQIKIEGVVTVFAGLVAGIFLFVFDRINWVNFLHTTFLIIPFVALWIYVIMKMHERYKSTLVETLERIKKKGRKLFSRLFETSEASIKYLQLKDDAAIIRALEITEKVNPLFFEKLATRYQKHRSESVQEFLKEKLSLYEINFAEANEPAPKKETTKQIRLLALEAIKNAEKGDHVFFTKEQLASLSRSDAPEDRILAANALRFLMDDSNIFLLIELLRDRDIRVKKVALRTASQAHRPETWSVIIEMLGHEKMSNYAIAAIIKIGENILPVLENYFHKSENSPEILLRIVRIYSHIRSDISYDYLFKKLDYPNHAIRRETIRALKDIRSEVKGYKRTLINATLEHELAKTFWNQMALSEIPSESYTEELQKALESEISRNFEIIFNLLGILYDQKSVILVKENFQTGSHESIAFALELLNIFVDEELKPVLFPVIDTLSPSEKLAKLREEFPRGGFDGTEALLQIIFRETGLVSNWTKVCALYAYVKSSPEIIDDVIKAQVFSEHTSVRTSALWSVKKLSPGVFYDITDRLKKTNRTKWAGQLQHEFESIEADSEMPLYMELVLRLKSFDVFKDVSPEILAELVLSGDVSTPDNGSLENAKTASGRILIVVKGAVRLENKENQGIDIHEGEVFDNIVEFSQRSDNFTVRATARDTLVLLLDQNHFFRLSTEYEELMDAFALHTGATK